MGTYKVFKHGYINESTDEWGYVEPSPPMPDDNDGWGYILDQLRPKAKVNKGHEDNGAKAIDKKV